MKTVNKQTVLKGALLLALATNVSWKTASSLTSIDMASELGGSVAAAPPAPATVRLAPVNPSAVTTSAKGPRPDAPATATQVAVTTEANPKLIIPTQICDSAHVIVLSDSVVDGEKIVRGIVQKDGKNIDSIIAIQKKMSVARLTPAATDKFVNHFKKEVEAKFCSDEIIAGQPTAPATPTAPADNKEELEKRQRDAKRLQAKIKRGLENCTGDEAGKALTFDEKLDCHMDRIASADLEDQMDEDDSDSRETSREERRQRRGERRNRTTRDTFRSSASAKFDASVDFVMSEIAPLLASRDEEDQEDGKDLKERLVDALKEAKQGGVISRAQVSAATARVNNLAVGERFQKHTESLESQVSTLDQNISSLTMRLSTAQDPYTSQAIGMQLQALRSQKDYLATTLPKDSFFTQYNALRSNGMVGTEEFGEFTSDYQQLLAMLSGGQAQPGQPGQTSPGQQGPVINVPQGAQQARAALAQQNIRNNGVSMPAYPQLSAPRAF